MKTENEVRADVMEYLQKTGWFVFWNFQKGYQSYAGISDLTAVKHGVVLWIELKTEKGTLRESQENFKADMDEAGGNYLIVRKWEDVHDWAEKEWGALLK